MTNIFQMKYERQSRVLEAVRSALRHSISGKDLITGNITVLGGIHIKGVSIFQFISELQPRVKLNIAWCPTKIFLGLI